MQELLFLAHRIPYPPNKGDKVRSYHLLKGLAQRYRVHLGAFIDDPLDWTYVGDVRKLCGETYFAGVNPLTGRLRSLLNLARNQPLTLAYFHDPALQTWVDRMLDRFAIRRALVFSSAMAQYLSGPRHRALQRVIDFVDVDSAKWLQYSRRRGWPLSWLYRRESHTLLRFERRIAQEFDASVFVTAAEAAEFRRLAPATASRTFHADNGIDSDFFTPGDYPNPYPAAAQPLAFTGAMDYQANVDAVDWFARTAFPAIRATAPAAGFYIVGARPTAAVRRLERLPGVRVVGAVADIRPYLAHARLATAPLRIARGVQNKVLEAMAMARPVLLTSAAAEGLLPCEPLAPWIANDPAELARLAVRLLTVGDGGSGAAGRAWVLRHCRWDDALARIERLLEQNTATAAAAAPVVRGEA